MTELGFQERSSWRLGLRARDSSPDSVVFTLESNLSLFSSASASVDRCSFASDSHDHDSFVSEISLQHLAGREGSDFAHSDIWSGPGPNPNESAVRNKKKHSRFGRKREKAKVQDEDSDADIQEPVELDSARNSFSLALKECQDKRSRSEALLKKAASLDVNNASGSSPRLQTVKKSTLSSRRCGTATFPSPGTPNYHIPMQKGWSSERVPFHASATQRHVLPFNNGKALPSKWEDAERWILSPVSGDGTGRASLHVAQRRPKSKSGPLGPPGVAYHSMYSPAAPVFEVGNGGSFMAGSPFSGDGLKIPSSDHGGALFTRTEPCMARSASVHGCSKMQSQSSSMPTQEDKFGGFKDVGTNVSPAVSRRDMATQMSPQGSPCSSPNLRPSFSASTPSTLPITELRTVASSKVDIRDVQVDEHVTVTRWSKKHRALFTGRGSEHVESWKKKEISTQSSTWDISETSKTVSKAKSEEAKISAWENLQKAKAEAAIRKLEMKLEKRRAFSMDKIMSKLRLAQKKAQEMRSSVPPNQTDRVVRTSHKASSFLRTSQMRSLSGCFTCHAF
ncbi:Remorin, C-terminal [Spatholobus suberectus]|nr:Remorin, C-terminal [Spatholobus suberectus]